MSFNRILQYLLITDYCEGLKTAIAINKCHDLATVFSSSRDFSPQFKMDQTPSLVLGQPDFKSIREDYPNVRGEDEETIPSQGGLDSPWGITFDRNGDLWVADTGNNRILKFDHNTPPPLIEYVHPTTKYPPPIIKYTPSSPSSSK